MKENTIKGALSLVFSGIAVYFRNLIGPLIVLAVVMLIDYITGMTQAWISATLSSRAGILGLIKKIGYLFAVAVAVVVDYIIRTAAQDAGVDLPKYFVFALLVTIWLILNECISILENLSEIGVPLPGFLMAIVKKLKKTTEKEGDELAEDDEKAAEDLPEHPPDSTD